MTRGRSGRSGRWYFGAIVAVLLLSNVAGALYAAAGLPMPGGIGAVCYLLLTVVVYFWFRGFAADHDIGLPLDMGVFLYVAWWAIVPFYLFKVRGVKAMWTILAFLLAYAAAQGISLLVFHAVA